LKVLIITQYFWPENFRVNDVVLFLKKKNIDVDILTGYPNYPDGVLFKEFKEEPLKYSNYNGAKVFRIPIYLRRESSKINLFINYISFIFSAIIFGYFHLRKKKYDIIFSFATSPITSSIPGIFYAKINKCKNFIWVLDLWPDIIKELKIINNNIIYKIFSAGVLKIYKAYDVVLVQSKSFLNILKNYNLNLILHRYETECYFGKHVDNGIDYNKNRIYSVGFHLISEYEGGDYILYNPYSLVDKTPGVPYLNKASVEHEVTPIISGLRKSALIFIEVGDLIKKNIL